MERKTGVIVVTHGSRLAAANDSLVRFAERLRGQLGADRVEPCFMELGEPDIGTAIGRLVARGCNHIFGYALFLVPGRHLQEDIPALIEAALRGHPGVTWELTEPMLDDPALLDVVARRVRRSVADLPTPKR